MLLDVALGKTLGISPSRFLIVQFFVLLKCLNFISCVCVLVCDIQGSEETRECLLIGKLQVRDDGSLLGVVSGC